MGNGSEYFIKNSLNEEQGPFDEVQIKNLIDEKKIVETDLIRDASTDNWLLISKHESFKNEFKQNPDDQDKTVIRSLTNNTDIVAGNDDDVTVIKDLNISTEKADQFKHIKVQKPNYVFTGKIELDHSKYERGEVDGEFDFNSPLGNGEKQEFQITGTLNNEPTQALNLKNLKKNKSKIFSVLFAVFGVIAILMLFDDDKKKTDPNENTTFKIELPVADVSDPQKAQKLLQAALPHYLKDTTNGYKKSAAILLKAASYDMNNVQVLCLLASSYMNLFDYVDKNEKYFNTITKLIEIERAKNVDLNEVVIADVELYLLLANPDAAISRIIEFSKTHTYGPEMYYYLAYSYYVKSDFDNAYRYLSKIETKNWFSPKIPYLYGLIFNKNKKNTEAVKAFETAVQKNSFHLKSHAELVSLYISEDKYEQASKHADFIIENSSQASKYELSRAYYGKSRISTMTKGAENALKFIELAMQNTPDDPDVLLEYYFLKSRVKGDSKDARARAKMYDALLKGETALRAENYSEAMSNFLTARQAYEKDPLPLIRLSELFQRKGEITAAKVNMAKAVKTSPSKSELYPKLISLLIQAYEFQEAKKNIDIYKSLEAKQFELDLLNGELYYKQKLLTEANSYFKRAVNSSNASAKAYVSYASVLYDLQQYQDASFYFGLALRFDPYNTAAVSGIAKGLSELEGVERGVSFLQDKIRLFPEKNKVELMNSIGEIYYKKGDYKNAFDAAQATITVSPEYGKAFKLRADVYVVLEKYKEAIDSYTSFTNYSPADPSGNIELYNVYMKKHDYGKARESIEKVIVQYPKYPGAYYLLGEMFKDAQNLKAAMEAAQKEVKNNPLYIPAYILAGSIYLMNKNYQNALEVLNDALKLNPNNIDTLILAGDANRLTKSYPTALSFLKRALSMDNGNPNIHKRLGQLYVDMGDMNMAKQHIRAYLDLMPNAQDKEEMQTLLNR